MCLDLMHLMLTLDGLLAGVVKAGCHAIAEENPTDVQHWRAGIVISCTQCNVSGLAVHLNHTTAFSIVQKAWPIDSGIWRLFNGIDTQLFVQYSPLVSLFSLVGEVPVVAVQCTRAQ